MEEQIILEFSKKGIKIHCEKCGNTKDFPYTMMEEILDEPQCICPKVSGTVNIKCPVHPQVNHYKVNTLT